MLEVTFNLELPDIVSFSFAKGCLALFTSCFLGSIGYDCLYGNNCCDYGLSVLNNVPLARFVMIYVFLASPSINSAVTVLSVLIVLADAIESLKGVQAAAIVSVLCVLRVFHAQNDWDLVVSQDRGVVVESLNDIILSQVVIIKVSIVCS